MRAAARIAAVYALIAAFWILFSDRLLLDLLATDPRQLTRLQTFKGLAFVAVTTLLLYLLLRRELGLLRRAQHTLRESEESLQSVFENAPIGMAVVALDQRFLKVNRELCAILGYSPEQLLATTVAAITHPDDIAPELELKRKIGSGAERYFFMEKRYLHADGHIVWGRLSVSLVVDAAGRPDHYIGQLEDITQRKQAEEQVSRYAGELERRVAERTADLEAFAYTVSHDLRAPLRAMQGFASALSEDYEGALDASGRDYVRRIAAATARMDALIQDLLAYSHLSRAPLEHGTVALADAVAEALAQLQAEIAARGAQVEVVAPLPQAHGHHATVVQVVSNLLSNAIKFTAPGATPRVRIVSEPRDGMVRLWIEDNGIGIAPEHRERIFGIFERLHGVETYPGTGIGLAIARRGVERMGGAAGVESKPGAGSRFWIELPQSSE